MCFIVSIVGLVMAYNFLLVESYLLASISVAISILFLYFMIKNILYVKKLKESRDDS